MRVTEVIEALGHQNVRAANKTTFEITKETFLTRRGDCIVAVSATKGAADLHVRFREAARNHNARITIAIEADDEKEVVEACGSPLLTFSHPTDLVVRKSDYVCGRTLAIGADKAAEDFSRRLVDRLRNPEQRVKITLTAEKPY